jgi:hypothetical protein
MPRCEKLFSALARTSFSCSIPTVAKTGRACTELTVGLALCAATQIEHEADSLCVGWLWVDSAATVHNIRDSDNQADHRTHKRIRFPVWELDAFELTKVIHRVARAAQVTIEGGQYCGGHAATRKRTYFNSRNLWQNQPTKN